MPNFTQKILGLAQFQKEGEEHAWFMPLALSTEVEDNCLCHDSCRGNFPFICAQLQQMIKHTCSMPFPSGTLCRASNYHSTLEFHFLPQERRKRKRAEKILDCKMWRRSWKRVGTWENGLQWIVNSNLISLNYPLEMTRSYRCWFPTKLKLFQCVFECESYMMNGLDRYLLGTEKLLERQGEEKVNLWEKWDRDIWGERETRLTSHGQC